MFRSLLSPILRSTKTVTTASGNRYTVLLSAAIVEELELISNKEAQVKEFILSVNCSTCFGRYYHPSSGAQNNCNYSIW
jgi:hypothetical protein